MLAIELSVNIIWLPVVAILSALAGFALRTAQISQSKKRILFLENEMLNSHAEILKLQQELVALKKNMSFTNKSRVVPMKDPLHDEKKDNPDLGERKSTGK